MKKLKLLTVLAMCAVAGAVSAKATDKALLNTLVQKGYLTSEEARNLSKTSNHKDMDRGDVFGEQPDTNSIAIGGTAHFRYQYVDPTLKNRLNTGPDLGRSSSPYIRKATIGLKASVWDDIRVEVAGKYSGGTNVLDTALISWDYMEEFAMDAGFGPTPASFENMLSGSELKTAERSIASQYFGGQLGFGDSHVGIFMRGQNVADLEGWRYFAAITRSDNPATTGSTDATVTSGATGRNSYPAFFASTDYKFEYEDVHFQVGLNVGYQRNQRGILAVNGLAGELAKTNDFMGSFFVNTMWEDFSMLAEVYGASLDRGKVVSATDKSRAKPTGLTIMPSYMYDDQYEFVLAYSMIRARNASMGDSAAAFTTNSRGVDLTSVSNQILPGQTTANNTGYNDVSSYYVGMNYFPIKASRQLKLGAGYEFIKARKASTDALGGGAGTIRDTSVDAHLFRADVRLVF